MLKNIIMKPNIRTTSENHVSCAVLARSSVRAVFFMVLQKKTKDVFQKPQEALIDNQGLMDTLLPEGRCEGVGHRVKLKTP
jgi:hypothetical protein